MKKTTGAQFEMEDPCSIDGDPTAFQAYLDANAELIYDEDLDPKNMGIASTYNATVGAPLYGLAQICRTTSNVSINNLVGATIYAVSVMDPRVILKYTFPTSFTVGTHNPKVSQPDHINLKKYLINVGAKITVTGTTEPGQIMVGTYSNNPINSQDIFAYYSILEYYGVENADERGKCLTVNIVDKGVSGDVSLICLPPKISKKLSMDRGMIDSINQDITLSPDKWLEHIDGIASIVTIGSPAAADMVNVERTSASLTMDLFSKDLRLISVYVNKI